MGWSIIHSNVFIISGCGSQNDYNESLLTLTYNQRHLKGHYKKKKKFYIGEKEPWMEVVMSLVSEQ